MPGGGGGADLDVVTALAGDVLKGKVIVDADGNPLTGTLELTGDAADSHVLAGKTYYNTDAKTKRTGSMPNQGAVNQALNAGGSYTIPAGYHNGGGKVTANSLSGQTSATAAAGDILTGKTAYVNGNKVTGTMATLAGGTYTPGTGQQTISCSGKKMTSNIVINAIPSTYVNVSSGSVAVFNMGSVSYIGEFVACGSSGSYEDGTLNSSGTLPGFNDDGSMNYGGSKGGICFKRSVDMTSFSKIRITYTPNTSNPGTQKIGVANTSKTILIASGWTPERKTTSTSSTTLCTHDIDISSIKQQAVFFLHSNGVSASIIIKKIELIV